MRSQWGAPPGIYYTDDDGTLALAGLMFGNVFVAVQPPRGYGMDKTAIMHKPDLAPPPNAVRTRSLSTISRRR